MLVVAYGSVILDMNLCLGENLIQFILIVINFAKL